MLINPDQADPIHANGTDHMEIASLQLSSNAIKQQWNGIKLELILQQA